MHRSASLLLLTLLLTLGTSRAQEDSRVFLPLLGDLQPEQVFVGSSLIYALFLYPSSTITAETPYSVRLTLVQAAANYDARAPCHPTALSFLGTRDRIPDDLCDPRTSAIRAALLNYYVMLHEFPAEAAFSVPLLQHFHINLEPDDDPASNSGWAFNHAKRLLAFFSSDGWNGDGLRPAAPYVRRYADDTGYKPANAFHLPIDKLRFPLRWQPLEVDADGRGRYFAQVHAFPHLGEVVTPLTLSSSDYDSRKARPLYRHRSSFRKIHEDDKELVEGLIDEALEIAKNVTRRQRILARWWDIKYASLGAVSVFYDLALNMTTFDAMTMYLGDFLAQHDALLVAWRNKRRHDLVRPQTLIRRQRAGQLSDVFVAQREEVLSVNMSYYESVQPSQPHSEYPSASALMCQAVMTSTSLHARKQMDRLFGPFAPLPRFELEVTRSRFNPIMPDGVAKVRFDSVKQAIGQCGTSRLWAGVHFKPAVREGWRLGKGIGEIAHRHISELVAGRVPEHCARCGKF